MEEIRTNRQYKDRLFRFIFGNSEWKENTLELYNALNDSHYTDPDELELTTIDDIIYLEMKNDLSFIIGDEMNLYEQQSTYNPNMPLRGLMCFAKLYDQYIKTHGLNVYGSKQLALPRPEYVVFYNGKKKTASRETLRLSDSFTSKDNDADGKRSGSNDVINGGSAIEVTTKVININEEIGDELLKKSRKLHEYSLFVHKVRGKIEKGMTADDAIHATVDECIHEDILSKILLKHKSEVIDMIITEYNAAEHEALIRKEAHAEGIAQGKAEGIAQGKAEGIAEGKIEIIQFMYSSGKTPAKIAELTGVPYDLVTKYINKYHK